jgi:spore coat protein CotH
VPTCALACALAFLLSTACDDDQHVTVDRADAASIHQGNDANPAPATETGLPPLGGPQAGDAGATADVPAAPDAGGIDGPPAPVVEFFQEEIIHRIEITMNPMEWQLYLQDHTTYGLRPEPRWFRADFRIDGVALRDVGFHTFGFGSRLENKQKPNFSIDINHNVDGQTLFGVTRMRIKNSGQDVSALRQVITYEALRKAGLLAPKSTYADIIVNGEPYGFYAVEEAFTKRFVREHVGNDNGPAYEAQGCRGLLAPKSTYADIIVNGEPYGFYAVEEAFTKRFVREHVGNDNGPAYEAQGCRGLLAPPDGCEMMPGWYNRDFNETIGQGEDLIALCNAANGPPERFMTDIAAVVNLPEWIDHVAMNTALIGDFDGFSRSGSNFRLYHDTATNKFRLIVLGPDDSYAPDRLPEPDPVHPAPKDSCADPDITGPQFHDIFLERLVATPEGLAMYQQAVRKLRTGVMAPAVLKARIDALWAIIGPHVKADTRNVPYMDPEQMKESIKRYIELRWPALEAAGL